MAKFGPRKQGPRKFVQEMMDDIASKRRWIANALGVHEDDPALTRKIQEMGQLKRNQLSGAQLAQQRQQQAEQPRAVAVSSDSTELEVEMVKTINRGRTLLRSLIETPGGSR